MRGNGNPGEDLQAIEDLHRRDMEASRTGDFETLRSILSDDAVILPPGGRPVRGKAEIDASFARMDAGASGSEVLEYVLDVGEVEILGAYAFEWGEIRGAVRLQDGEIRRSAHNVMRVLRREPSGGWKVYRSIWNDKPLEDPEDRPSDEPAG